MLITKNCFRPAAPNTPPFPNTHSPTTTHIPEVHAHKTHSLLHPPCVPQKNDLKTDEGHKKGMAGHWLYVPAGSPTAFMENPTPLCSHKSQTRVHNCSFLPLWHPLPCQC